MHTVEFTAAAHAAVQAAINTNHTGLEVVVISSAAVSYEWEGVIGNTGPVR